MDATSVYWTNRGTPPDYMDGAVMKVRIDGGSPTLVDNFESGPQGIAVDATNVYWTAGSTVRKAGIDGGMFAQLASMQSNTYGIAVDATSVYWTAGSTVMKVGIGGFNPMQLAAGAFPLGIAVDATSVYWTEVGGTVMKEGIDGGTATPLALMQSSPWGIAVDATSVYWANGGGGTVMKVAK